MSKTNDDGGPAFSRAASNYDQGAFGMSLRDYFAAQALVGLLARAQELPAPNGAAIAYDYADALLRARVRS